MLHPLRCPAVDNGDMNGVLPPERRRYHVAINGQPDAALTAAFAFLSDTPRLIAFAGPVLTGIGGMKEEMDRTAARRRVDPFRSQDKMPGPCFQAQPVEKRLFQPALDTTGKIVDEFHLVRLEGAAKQPCELAFGMCGFDFIAGDTDPCTATGGTGEQVGGDLPVGTEGKPNEPGPGPVLTAQYAFPYRLVRSLIGKFPRQWRPPPQLAVRPRTNARAPP
jgi:hypothetical protein